MVLSLLTWSDQRILKLECFTATTQKALSFESNEEGTQNWVFFLKHLLKAIDVGISIWNSTDACLLK